MLARVSFVAIICSWLAVPLQAASEQTTVEDFETGFSSYWLYTDSPATPSLVLATSTEQAYSGSSSLKVSWRFLEGQGFGAFSAFGHYFTPAWGSPLGYSMWVYGNNQGVELVVRLVDASGQTFQRSLGIINWTGWKQIDIPVAATGQYWGGANNGVMTAPAHLQDIVIGWSSGCTIQGSIYIDSVMVTSEIAEGGEAKISYVKPAFVTAGKNTSLSFDVNYHGVPAGTQLGVDCTIAKAGGPVIYENSTPINVEGDGTVRAAVSMAIPYELGEYQVTGVVKRLTGETMGTCQGKAISLVNADPGDFEENSLFGICQKSPWGAEHLAAAGAKWVRLDINYDPSVSSVDDYLQSNYDDIVAKAAEHKTLILPILEPRSLLSQPGSSTTAWGQWVTTVVNRYKDHIKYWEIANEPNLATTSQWYSTLAKVAYQSAKSADPNCKIGAFSTSSITNLTFIESCLRYQGMAGYFDFVTVHAYQNGGFSSQVLITAMQSLKNLLAAYHVSCPIWITEFGWASNYGGGGVTIDYQADLLGQMDLTCAALGYKAFWYCEGDWPAEVTDPNGYFGIFYGDGRLKPAFYMYNMVAYTLAGAQGQGQFINVPAGCTAWQYQLNDGRKAIGIWSGDASGVSYSLDLSSLTNGNSVELLQMGQLPQVAMLQNHVLQIDLSTRPVILIANYDASWYETFSRDPLTAGGGVWSGAPVIEGNANSNTGLSWDSGNGNLICRNNNDSKGCHLERSLGSTVTDGQSFTFSYDFKIDYTYYAAQVLAGLTSSQGQGMITVEVQPLYGYVWPSTDYFYIDYMDKDGNKNRQYTNVAINFYDHHTYGVTVNYVAATRTLSFTMVDRSNNNSAAGTIFTWPLPEGSSFSVDRFSVFNATPTSGLLVYSWGDILTNFDNIFVGYNVVNRLAGDANGDGVVDVSDLGILAANYGKTSGATWSQGDFNGDGVVDVSDLGILAANYGRGSNSGMDFKTDYAKIFGSSATQGSDTALAADEKTEDGTSTGLCGSLGFSLIAGFFLMGLMLVKTE